MRREYHLVKKKWENTFVLDNVLFKNRRAPPVPPPILIKLLPEASENHVYTNSSQDLYIYRKCAK